MNPLKSHLPTQQSKHLYFTTNNFFSAYFFGLHTATAFLEKRGAQTRLSCAWLFSDYLPTISNPADNPTAYGSWLKPDIESVCLHMCQRCTQTRTHIMNVLLLFGWALISYCDLEKHQKNCTQIKPSAHQSTEQLITVEQIQKHLVQII